MSDINFIWALPEENFRRMMAEEQTSDIFGSLYFGKYLVEFRCTGGGFDDDYHIPTTDVYIYGVEGSEGYFLCNGVPYHLLDDEIFVPKRRTLESFKRRVEAIVYEMLGGDTEITDENALCETLGYDPWNPEAPEEEDEVVCADNELRIPTQIGTIRITDKGYGREHGYPGAWIGIERNGKLFDIAMVEVDQECDEDEEPLIKCHVYCDDPNRDDPIYEYVTTAKSLDKYLERVG